MDQFFIHDPEHSASKGLVFIGDCALIIRRDDQTDVYPDCLDLPGDTEREGETPFLTFRRAVKTAFGIDVEASDVTYARRYPDPDRPGKYHYFPVALLPDEREASIVFGPVGSAYYLMTLADYLAKADAWPLYQLRAQEFLTSIEQAMPPGTDDDSTLSTPDDTPAGRISE